MTTDRHHLTLIHRIDHLEAVRSRLVSELLRAGVAWERIRTIAYPKPPNARISK